VPTADRPVSPVLAVPVLSTSRPLTPSLPIGCLHQNSLLMSQRCSPEVMDTRLPQVPIMEAQCQQRG
jgi:hypothetical protein